MWHHFDIPLAGPEISVYVDELSLFTYTDLSPDPYLSGGIAAVSYSGGVIQHQTVFVDNVRVSLDAVATQAVSWSHVKSLYR